MEIAILGGGSWGTALAVHLANNGHKVKVWEFFEELANKMQEERVCKFLPGTKLSENITISSKIEEVLPSELVLLVVPSDKVESTLEMASEYITNQSIIICSKGFASELKLLSEVVEHHTEGGVYCLYGPTHAEEVCQGKFSGIVLAGEEGKDELAQVFENELFKVDLSGDLIGVQVCSALKNVLAVFVGVLDGIGYGDNAKAYVMTKGLQEITKIGLHWGAQEKTFLGLAGIGDVIVTCTSQHSRNRHLGEQIGRGRDLKEVLEEMPMIAEGFSTAKLIPDIKEKFELELPLLSGLYAILLEGKDPVEVLKGL